VDKVKIKTKFTIHKFFDPEGEIEKLGREGKSIEEILKKFRHRFIGLSEFEKNVFLNEGINAIWTLVCGGTETPFNNTNSYIGVGNSTTAENPTQTGLLGTSKYYKGMDAGYPTFGTDQKAVWRATFGGTEANFAWNEFTVANGNSDAAKNLNRKVSPQGTKQSGQTWILSITLSLS